jgi:hypothetical protein
LSFHFSPSGDGGQQQRQRIDDLDDTVHFEKRSFYQEQFNTTGRDIGSHFSEKGRGKFDEGGNAVQDSMRATSSLDSIDEITETLLNLGHCIG